MQLAITVSFVVALLAIVATRPWLRRIAIDEPNQRSSHELPTPRAGGVGLFAGMSAGVAAAPAGSSDYLLYISSILFMLLILGFLDDVRSLGIGIRLAFQCALSLALAVVLIQDQILLWAVPCSLFVVCFVNTFNFMDGVNGISGFTAIVCGGWYGYLGIVHHDLTAVAFGFALLGSSTAFAVLNFAGWIFLGDSGSYVLGGTIAAMCVTSIQAGAPFLTAGAPLLIYVADVTVTLISRLRKGKRLGEAHRDHVYQRLARTSLGHMGSASLAASAALMCCVATLLVPMPVALAVVSLVVLGYLSAPRLLANYGGVT